MTNTFIILKEIRIKLVQFGQVYSVRSLVKMILSELRGIERFAKTSFWTENQPFRLAQDHPFLTWLYNSQVYESYSMTTS